MTNTITHKAVIHSNTQAWSDTFKLDYDPTKMVEFAITQFSFMNNFYPISGYDTNMGYMDNTLRITENGTARTVTIAFGMYTSTSFATALQTALGGGYTVSEVTKTSVGQGYYSISQSSYSTCVIDRIGFWRCLGAVQGSTITLPPSTTTIMPNAYNFVRTNNVYLVANEGIIPSGICYGTQTQKTFGSGSSVTYSQGDLIAQRVLAVIPVNVLVNSICLWNNRTPADWFQTINGTLGRIGFQFIDDDGLAIDFRGITWCLEIVFRVRV